MPRTCALGLATLALWLLFSVPAEARVPVRGENTAPADLQPGWTALAALGGGVLIVGGAVLVFRSARGRRD